MAITARRLLWAFLTDRFTETGALVRFVDHYFSDVRRDVNLDAALSFQVDSLIAVLIDYGLVDQIWDALRIERPQFSDEIDKIRRLWENEHPPASRTIFRAPGVEPPLSSPAAVDGGRVWLAREVVLDVHRAAALAGLEHDRVALLLDVPDEAIASVDHVPSPRAQMLLDLHHLASGGHGVEPVRAWIANARAIAPDGADTAAFSRALDTLSAMQQADEHAARLSDAEAGALEALVSDLRPILVARGDTLAADPSGPFGAALEAARPFVERALRATGRLRVRNHPLVEWSGNVFVVADDLVCTARHALLAPGETGEELEYAVDFDDEQHTVGWSHEFPVAEVALVCESFDVAFLRVPGLRGAGIEPLPLARSAPAPGDAVARVTFVAPDPRVDAEWQERAVGGSFELKRVLVGEVMGLDDEWPHARLKYDTNTLAGVSGSPVVSLASGDVLGIGTMRRYLEGNWAVASWELLTDPAVAALDARFRS